MLVGGYPLAIGVMAKSEGMKGAICAKAEADLLRGTCGTIQALGSDRLERRLVGHHHLFFPHKELRHKSTYPCGAF